MPYSRKLKRTGRGLKQYKSAYPTNGGSSLANAVKMGATVAGMSAGGRRIANNLMRLKKRLGSMTRTIVIRKKKQQATHVVNHSEKSRTTNLAKRRTAVGNALQLVRANAQYTMYKWNGIKNFDDNGYYWLSNFVDGLNRRLPCYLFDLTGCRNSGPTGTITATPFVQMYSDQIGRIYSVVQSGLQADGVSTSSGLQVETSSAGATLGYHPHARDMLKWVSIKMNCWGCKNRSTKFIVQLVQFKEDNLAPSHVTETGLSTTVNDERSALFQHLLKPLIYNPIATTSALHSRKLKVLKTESFIIDSTSTTETDQDPNVKVLKWFVNLNRICNYVENAARIEQVADFADQADFATNTNNQQFGTQTEVRTRIYLMIRASNYGSDAEQTNADTPSFDLQVGMKHVNFN